MKIKHYTLGNVSMHSAWHMASKLADIVCLLLQEKPVPAPPHTPGDATLRDHTPHPPAQCLLLLCQRLIARTPAGKGESSAVRV